MKKELYEGFAKFFETPTRESLRELLQRAYGESENIDFKEILPDKTKLAKSILAFANSGGGILIIGVKDGTPPVPVGASIEDKTDIQNRLTPFLPNTLEYEILDFSYSETEYPTLKGKSFQVILVESQDKYLPYICKKTSGNHIKSNVVYIRKNTSSREATHDDFQDLINKRIETGYSSKPLLDLEEHLDQLKILYSMIPKSLTSLGLLSLRSVLTSVNPDAPKESFEAFIRRAIELKKAAILKELNV